MAVLTVTASLNKSSFGPGEVMVLTVTYYRSDDQPDLPPTHVTTIVGDAASNQSAPASVADVDVDVDGRTAGTVVVDALTVIVTDDSDRVWTRLSDNGSVAVYQAVA